MKKLLSIMFLILGILYADNCDDYKKKAIKYEQMGISSDNLDIGAKYLKMSIKNKKEAINSCFYSGLDKEKIYRDIKEMQELAKNMKKESAKKRQHDIDVAKERSNIHVNHRYDFSNELDHKR